MNSYFNNNIKGAKTGAVLLFVLVTLLALYNPYNKTNISIFLSIVIIAVSVIPYFLWKRRKNRNVVILGVLFYGFFHMIGYGFAGFMDHLNPQTLQGEISNASEYIAKTLVIYHLLIVFGGLYILQSLFKNSKSTNINSPKASINAYRFTLVICLFLTVVEYLRGLGIPPFSMMGGIVVSIITFLAFMYLFYFLFYLNFGGWFIKILAIIGCLIAQGALLSASINPYAEVGLILALISCQKGRFPIVPMALLILMFVIYQPMKGAVRIMMDQGGYGVADSIATGFDAIEGSAYLDLIDIASKRTDYNNLLSSFVEHIGVRDKDDYIGWKGYENLLYAFIPRIIWQDKPSDHFANSWAVQEGYLGKDDYTTAYNLPWLPQMYLSFGFYGIIVGSFFIAIILFLLERYYWTIRLDPWSFAIGYSIMRAMLHLEADAAMIFSLVIKIVLIDIAVRMARKLLIANRQNKSTLDRKIYNLKSS